MNIILHRRVSPDLSSLNVQERTVEAALSSEKPYLRSFGYEILSHKKEHMDFEYLDAGAALCFDHDLKDTRGGIVEYKLTDDGVLRVVLKFSRKQAGEELFQDIQDGISGQMSAGYFVKDMEQIGEQDGTPVFLITKWTIFEGSVVPAAADTSVGIGRGISASEDSEELKQLCTRAMERYKNRSIEPVVQDVEVKEQQAEVVTQEQTAEQNTEAQVATPEVTEQQPDEARVEDTQAEGSQDTAQANDDADPELVRVKSLTALGAAFKAEELAEKFIKEGKSSEEFKRHLDQKPNITIKKESKKMSNFNFNESFRHLALHGKLDDNAQEMHAQVKAKFPGVLEKSFRPEGGLALPTEVLFSRAYNVSTPEKGGDVIDTTLDGSKLIEALYATNPIGQLGINVLQLTGETQMPKQLISDVVTYGYGETTDAAMHDESTFEIIKLSPHRIAFKARVTVQMLMQSSFDIQALLQKQLYTKFGLEQLKMIFGAGGLNQPVGLEGQGIDAVTGAQYATNARAKLIEMTERMDASFGVPTNFYMNYRTYAKFKQVKLDDGSGKFLGSENRVEDYNVVMSQACPDNTVYLGDWNTVTLANFGAVNLYLDANYTGGTRDIIIEAFHDTAAARPEHIVKAVFA